MSTVQITGITKDYGHGRGVFDASFAVERGEVMGFLGPNGAGKTTTIRQLMGFICPDSGKVEINGMDCFTKAAQIQENVGYLPGEISFMDDMTGNEFIRFIAHMKNHKSMERAQELMRFFELDASGRIKKMSKGMKQKIGIVCAFMTDPALYILDEPSSGLDPLMQNKFVELIRTEKERGKTILMSSHMFDEVERTCDRTAIIRDGKIVAVENIERLRAERSHVFKVKFATPQEAGAFAARAKGASQTGATVELMVAAGSMDALIKVLAAYTVRDLQLRTQTLEELFMHFYGEGANT